MYHKFLGELDELVLLSIGSLGEDAYAFSIKEAIRGATGKDLALPTVHAALYRLEEKGLVDSRLGGATNARGGRRKRLFRVTSAGLQALEAMRTARDRLWAGMQSLKPEGGTS